MRVFVKENTLWKPLCVSNTSFVDTDEFLKEMHRFVLANGTVNNVYIVFENTKVPVSHVNGLSHNSSVQIRLRTDVPGKKNHKTKSSLSNRQRKENEKGEYWDEELKGDRRVYDASFEMNEDLVPWKTDKDWEEKYGLYT